ncbi:ABC-F family ATP-binding cassette domain-containing protein [Glutamicibacter protophormiae]|uniref:ATPase subunit of ABC transporter with duplicated ATPase domains n=1 Tax=Glutamicibacter protophormiae TaxID=37930 RepID=A0ABS4XQR2_GLUPR|nr:ABC-F family ATP-binding cassette domain-containing protein [Glutamicibacter protophormiae]MBP2398730.1 ATPase subunit of ABC transporter with duplicated ATPase domains [Glutamicibacter protophormiae]GGL82046.1 ABC transporter ATP-binding protein [Glutamicibacter protophormiae]
MAHLLGGEALHLEYPTHVVFDSVTIGISDGDRIGLVGRNGEGKSSLLGMLSGKIQPNSGRMTQRNGLRVGVLDQSDTLDSDSTIHYAVVGDMADHEWAGDARTRDIIAGLVADLDWEATVGTLSGGQRRRVALAALLVQDWDVVILDEPTNHLDVEGISWLAEHINERWSKNTGGLMVVTHDRWFLDAVCTTTWEVHDGIVEPFEGGYAAYVLQRVERDRIAAVTESKRQNMMKKELAWLRRGAPARTAKPKFRIEAANQLIADVPPVRNPLELKRMATSRLGKDVIDLLDTSVSFGPKQILKPFTWRIGPGERTGLLGANGAGKSTLLGLIAGTVEPSSGKIKRGKTVKLAVLDQQFRELDQIGEDLVREVLGRFRTTFNVDGKDLTPAQLLERLGFSSAHLSTKVRELSGGQRRRLQLLMILMDEPNVMILDEPTNDVDTDMLAALEDLLDSWPGTLIVVSHDRYLLERVTDQQYAILDGHFRHVPGGVDEYLTLRSAQGTGSGSNPSQSSGTEQAKPAGPSGAELRAAQKELNANERKVSQLQEKIAKIHEKMASHDQSDYEGLGKLTAEISELQDQVDELEERWLELSEIVG